MDGLELSAEAQSWPSRSPLAHKADTRRVDDFGFGSISEVGAQKREACFAPSSGHSSRRLSLKECSGIECCYFPRGQYMSTSAVEAAIPCLLEKR
jgi:hypothetical protein